MAPPYKVDVGHLIRTEETTYLNAAVMQTSEALTTTLFCDDREIDPQTLQAIRNYGSGMSYLQLSACGGRSTFVLGLSKKIERADRILTCDYPEGVDFQTLAGIARGVVTVFEPCVRFAMSALCDYL